MPNEQTILPPVQLNGTKNNEVSLPSPEDAWMGILSNKPHWLVRWGIVCFAGLLVLLFVLAAFIRYPDRVSAQGRLVAMHPPQPLTVRTNTRLLHLLCADGDSVAAGSLLAVLESNANYQHVLWQKRLADSLLLLATTAQNHVIPTTAALLTPSYPPPNLGELQNQRQVFFAALQVYLQYLNKGYFIRQRSILQLDLQNLWAQQSVTNEQLEITQKEVALAGENFKVSETLSEQKVIAPVEYRTEAGKWLGKQLQVPQLKNAQLAIKAQILEKQKQIAALENEITLQQGIFV